MVKLQDGHHFYPPNIIIVNWGDAQYRNYQIRCDLKSLTCQNQSFIIKIHKKGNVTNFLVVILKEYVKIQDGGHLSVSFQNIQCFVLPQDLYDFDKRLPNSLGQNLKIPFFGSKTLALRVSYHWYDLLFTSWGPDSTIKNAISRKLLVQFGQSFIYLFSFLKQHTLGKEKKIHFLFENFAWRGY